MVIYVGARARGTHEGYLFDLHCQKCGHRTAWVLMQVKKKATLFFVRIVPLGSEHLIVCELCGIGPRAQGEHLDRARWVAEAQAKLASGAISEAEFPAEFRVAGGPTLMRDVEAWMTRAASKGKLTSDLL